MTFDEAVDEVTRSGIDQLDARFVVRVAHYLDTSVAANGVLVRRQNGDFTVEKPADSPEGTHMPKPDKETEPEKLEREDHDLHGPWSEEAEKALSVYDDYLAVSTRKAELNHELLGRLYLVPKAEEKAVALELQRRAAKALGMTEQDIRDEIERRKRPQVQLLTAEELINLVIGN